MVVPSEHGRVRVVVSLPIRMGSQSRTRAVLGSLGLDPMSSSSWNHSQSAGQVALICDVLGGVYHWSTGALGHRSTEVSGNLAQMPQTEVGWHVGVPFRRD